MIRWIRTPGREPRRGQALVEFALIIPIFLLVMLGLFDMGRAVFHFSTISNATREAVRFGIVDQNTAKIRQTAVDSATGIIRLTTGEVTVTYLAPNLATGTSCSTPPYEIGCVIQVEIRSTFQPATPFVPPLAISADTKQPIERRYVSP